MLNSNLEWTIPTVKSDDLQYRISVMYIGVNGHLNIHCQNGDVWIVPITKLQ